jgi:hypothetical protein
MHAFKVRTLRASFDVALVPEGFEKAAGVCNMEV